MRAARLLGKVRGRRVFEFTVEVEQSGLDPIPWQDEAEVKVIAYTPDEACNLVRDEVARFAERPTTIETRGPKGGLVYRYLGWESLTWYGLCNLDRAQLELGVQVEPGL